MGLTGTARALDLDLPTLVAACALAWVTIPFVHEVVGHGGACVALGGDAVGVTSTELRCAGVSGAAERAVAAAGGAANLLAAGAVAGLAAVVRRWPPVPALLAWLCGAGNLVFAGSYLIAGAAFEFGDWSYVTEGLPARTVWRVVLGVAGYAICLAGVRLGTAAPWQQLFGADPERSEQRWRFVTRTALVTAVAVNAAAALASPLERDWALLNAALGGAVLLWLANTGWAPDDATPAAPVRRRPAWIVAGAVAALAFVALLGPGLGSFEGHPLARP